MRSARRTAQVSRRASTRWRASPSIASARVTALPVILPADGGPACAGSDVEIGCPERAIGLLKDGLDLALRLRRPLPGGAQPRDALVEERQRIIELGIVRLELADDLLEPGKLGRECGRRCRHCRGG